ncbi:hypothetical protein Ddye_023685 [Dipteronia dyeriana]|uniref:HAT C-terminal dimerisation domain-containing protein n=1 Tax=Dipteronia dyeriana TaxID=168575 RepID=A0AAD9TTW8_9ROSI|nr:hypothetical protein Ddye_023685 [Dipteronia dyeriana]
MPSFICGNILRSTMKAWIVRVRVSLLSQKTKKLRDSSSSSSSSVSYSEIETYHNTSFEFMGDGDVEKFDILHWWKGHERHFSILTIIAKQILGTQVSIVAIEQEFSVGGNILDARCLLLSPQSILLMIGPRHKTDNKSSNTKYSTISSTMTTPIE